MAEIKCPMCGKPNPSELDVCQFCEARLKPLTDELSRSQPPIHPGDKPTSMDTGELEPVLPQWLREVRQQARDSAEGEPEQAPEREEAVTPEKPADLLAGLQSQSDDDEEIPDWLTGLRGESAQSSTEETSEENDDLAALKSMFGEETPASEEDEDNSLPGWISGLGENETESQADEDGLSALFADDAKPAASGSGLDWAAEFRAESTPQADSDTDESPIDSSIPDWLQGSGEQTTSSETDGDLLAWMSTDEPAQADSGAASEEIPLPLEDGGDTPDWLASLGDESTDSAPQQQETVQPAAEGDMPDWLSSLGEESADSFSTQESVEPVAEGNTPDWLASLGDESADTASQQEPIQAAATESYTPDWLASLGEDANAAPQQEIVQPTAEEGDTPDWLASLGEESAEAVPQQQEVEQPATKGDMPDWLSSLGDESTDAVSQQESVQPATEGDMPDWLSSLGDEHADAVPLQEPIQPVADDDTPDWLSTLGNESTETSSEQQESSQPAAAEDDTPDWLASLGEESATDAPQQETLQPAAEGDLPDWLATVGVEGATEQKDESAPSAAFVEDAGQPALDGETPDWLSNLGGETIEFDQFTESVEQEATPAITTNEFTEKNETPSAFVDDEGAPLATDDVDALLSMDMPDWLSNVNVPASGDSPTGSPDAQIDELKPADLPNWVQSMRPVESVITETDGDGTETQPLEEKGPLAGLRGVLPAVPGVGPSSKPKAYSLKLNASEDQQSSAVMLEQMLAEEINPKPMVTQPVVLSQRVLRWIIALMLLLVVGGTVFSGTQINPMPTGAPLETSNALRYIQETLPAGAPVLLIFDYEAALAGELEAAAAPLIDHMLLLKHPRLSMVASKPTGTGLAERFMVNTQSSHNYQRGENFTNLGYLPGGAAGVLAFANNPSTVKPLSTSGENAWNTPVLQGVEKLSGFAAIILLTSDEESARIWIEQTENERGETRLLVVSSAQSGPMILPYVQSGQVDGMVTGLDGSAPIEQANSGRPGMVRRYWDAYGFGLLTAIGIIAIGSLWSLVTGWQARRKEQGEE